MKNHEENIAASNAKDITQMSTKREIKKENKNVWKELIKELKESKKNREISIKC